MISRLTLKNFTVFKEADFEFAPGLNVLVGENGTGKSHVLKAAYAVLAVLGGGPNRRGPASPLEAALDFDRDLARKLEGVFQVDHPGELVRRGGPKKKHILELAAEIGPPAGRLAVEIKDPAGSLWLTERPAAWLDAAPVFLPTRELLSIFRGFVSLYDNRAVSFDETWRDTCNLLGLPRLKGDRLEQVRPLWEAVQADLGGEVQLHGDHFRIATKAGDFSAQMVAEGQAKLGMLAHLIANGSIAAGTTLFWDEPEVNLNNKVIKHVARTILDLCKLGVQVFLSTHNMFLLRELYILQQRPERSGIPGRFIGLHPGKNGVKVEQGASEEDIGDLVAVDEELMQSDRYMDVEFSHARPH